MPDPTQFTESNALLAIIDDNPDGARAIVAGMLAGERITLARHAQTLVDLCERVQFEHEAAHGPCTAIRGCSRQSVGYFYMGRHRKPYGTCVTHRSDVEAEGFTVHTMPEVKL
jgi:hypothetical protein